MKQTTKNILGVAAIVVLSAGVAGVTTYKMQNKEKSATFSELFQQNLIIYGWLLITRRMRSLLT
mgnify:CR=1 FL=1